VTLGLSTPESSISPLPGRECPLAMSQATENDALQGEGFSESRNLVGEAAVAETDESELMRESAKSYLQVL
jgi:hypothetical protein